MKVIGDICDLFFYMDKHKTKLQLYLENYWRSHIFLLPKLFSNLNLCFKELKFTYLLELLLGPVPNLLS
jgi:hypothetical protein